MSTTKVLNQASGKDWQAYHGDSCEVLKGIPSNSIHYSIYSPPFLSLFVYTAIENDLGNCLDDSTFYEHFKFIAEELYRVMMPGRVMSFHCMNINTTKTRDGFIGIKDFRGDLIRFFQKLGFIYASEVCIFKDPLVAMQRTKTLGLLHAQVVKDAAMCRQGLPDYLVTMRKPGDNPERVTHLPRGFERFIGDNEGPTTKKTNSPRDNKYSHEVWQRYASPVWMDINQGETLQRASAREDKDEKHLCVLQTQVIERGVELWSNPGDIVLSPFMGIASEGVVSVNMSRRFIGCELKESYFKQAVANLKNAESKPLELF